MLTKRGITVVRHMLPEPNPVEREAALDQLSGRTDELRGWPTHVFDGGGRYLVIPPRVARELNRGGSDLIDWQFDSLFSRDVA